MKTLLVLLGIGIVAFAGYGVFKAGHLFDLKKTQTDVIKQTTAISQQVQSGVSNAQAYVESGMRAIGSGADRLLASGQVLLEQKKQEALKYVQQQKDLLKKQAQQALEDEAKKKVQGIFSGR